jgi:hypothetical protein
MTSSTDHWNQLYETQRPEQVSWFRAHLDASIELLLNAGLNPHSRVIDIGGGASTLVDDLLLRLRRPAESPLSASRRLVYATDRSVLMSVTSARSLRKGVPTVASS